MKNFIILLFAMLVASQAFSQKKGKEDKKDVKPDSVTQVIDTPSVKADSLITVTDTPIVKTDTAAAKVDSVAKTTPPAKTDSVAKVPAATTVVPAATVVVPVATTTKTDSVIKAASVTSLHMDSLTKLNQLLTAKFNNVSIELEKYKGMYTVIKERILKRDFDPAKFSQIVDSLVASRDSTQFGLAASSAALRDSLIAHKNDIMELKAKVDAAKSEDAAKLRLANELKLLKELLDSKIITQTEFDIKKTLVLQKWK